MDQPQASSVEMRPMGIGDILDTLFRLYHARFVPFLTIALLGYLPYLLYQFIVAFAVGTPIAESNPLQGPAFAPGEQPTPTPAQILLPSLGNLIFFLVVFPLVQAAMIFNIASAFLGQRQTAGESFRRASGRVVPLLGTQILVGLVVILGCLMCVVPGVIFSLWFLLVAPVVVLERTAGTSAMGRSRVLMKGNVGKGFLLMLVLTLLTLAVYLGAIGMMTWISSPPLVDMAVINLLEAVVLPLSTGGIILLYYDLRIRKEAFDLQHLAASVDGGQPPSPPTAPPPPPMARPL